MTEVADGIHRIDTALGERCNSLWLVRGSEHSVLYDAAIDTAIPTQVLPYLDGRGIGPATLSRVIVSHADVDHFGGVADAHTHFPNVRVAAHRLDAQLVDDYERFERERVRGFRSPWGYDEEPDAVAWCRSVARADGIDDHLAGGEEFDIGDRKIEVHHLPGHTRGQLGLRDVRTGTWFVSDAVLGASVPLADGTPAFAPTYRYVDDYLRTIELLENARPPLLCTAHYGAFDGSDAVAFLRESRDFVHDLERETVAALAELGPSTLRELLPVVNERVATWPLDGTEATLAFPLVGHLERLIARQRVTLTAKTTGAAIVALAMR